MSESAEVKGEIRGKKILIGGKMTGNVYAKELVEIRSKGKVLGDIFTQKLAIIEGAEFNGKAEMKKTEIKKEESNVIELELKGREVGKP
jgi:cytoskeletal protein CcmA (bactofilin family)